MSPAPYHRDDSSSGSNGRNMARAVGADASVSTPKVDSVPTATATAPLSLSIPPTMTATMKSLRQPEIISPTTFALAQKPILLDTPDRDTVCRPVATLQAPAASSSSNGNGNRSHHHPAGFELDIGIQNMTLLRPAASSAEMFCEPPTRNTNKSNANSNPAANPGQYMCAGTTCSLAKGSLVLLDTPDKDTVCRPTP